MLAAAAIATSRRQHASGATTIRSVGWVLRRRKIPKGLKVDDFLGTKQSCGLSTFLDRQPGEERENESQTRLQWQVVGPRIGSSERLVSCSDPLNNRNRRSAKSTLGRSSAIRLATRSRILEAAQPMSFHRETSIWAGDQHETSLRLGLLPLQSGRRPALTARENPWLGKWTSREDWGPRLGLSKQVSFLSTSTSQQQKGEIQNEQNKDDAAPSKLKVKLPSRVLARSKIPTPDSAPPVEDNPLANLPEPKSLIRKGTDLMVYLCRSVVMFLWKLPDNLYFYTFNHSERNAAMNNIQDVIKHEVNHYWDGTKLLWADIRTARVLLNKTLHGSSLTRRERKQLLRTVSDLFRLVPFSMFIILPFMEFALPFALRIFPNLLPSTFQDSLKAEENMKREVKSRIAMAQFFQETLEELAKEQERKANRRKEELIEAGVELSDDGRDSIDEKVDSAASMLEFLHKAQSGEMIPPDVIIRYANYFQDDLTLDNMPRMQLINMCKYMGMPPYGSDAFLRFQLRHKIRVLREDDQRILWEGIDSLTKMELREACQERGMRSTGLSKDAYKKALQQWLDLSVNKNVPISLLIMSRTFFLREDVFQRSTGDADKSPDSDITGLADTISGLDKEVLNEVILGVATSEERKSDPVIRKLKLEVLDQQNELIREEQEAREAAAAKKKLIAAEKEAPAEETDAIVREPLSHVSPDAKMEQPMAATEKSLEQTVSSEEIEEEKTVDDEEERDLSAEEMDALGQLLSDDPVSKEREDLEKLKATMKLEGDKKESPLADDQRGEGAVPTATDVGSDVSEVPTRETETGVTSTTTKVDEPTGITPAPSDQAEDEDTLAEDPLVQRLKKRIESMVDKIEVQLSDVQIKIGDKLHFLDKDKDGILSREEVASVLQQVFKRKISFEEAMEITNEMVRAYLRCQRTRT